MKREVTECNRPHDTAGVFLKRKYYNKKLITYLKKRISLYNLKQEAFSKIIDELVAWGGEPR
jgi:hypothetical protein